MVQQIQSQLKFCSKKQRKLIIFEVEQLKQCLQQNNYENHKYLVNSSQSQIPRAFSMWQIVKTNPKKYHFLAYCMSFIVYGALLTGMGPLIPYLAQNQHVPETQYSFFFFSRAVGFVIGAFFVKLIEKRITFHHTLIIFSTSIFVMFALFSWEDTMTFQGVYVFLGSIFCAITEIVLNVSLLTAHVGQHQQFYVQVGHGMFGVGGFISPFIVLYFEEMTYFVLGLLMFLIVPAYFILRTPQLQTQRRASQILQAGNLADEFKRIEQRISIQSENTLLRKLKTEEEKKQTIVYLICFLFFVYIGQEVAYGGWISSYAVLTEISTKEQATVYSSIFWAFMTAFRFIFAFISIKPSRKLQILITMQLVVTVAVIILVEVLDAKSFAGYFASIMYGISFSAMFGLFFVLPAEYGVQVTCEEGSSFLMYGQLGEGMISMVVGYLMSWFTPTMLYYSVLFCGFLLLLTCKAIIRTLIHNKAEKSFQKQMDIIVSSPGKTHKASSASVINDEIFPVKPQK